MNSTAAILGMGLAGGFGVGVEALKAALENNRITGGARQGADSGGNGPWYGHFADTSALIEYTEKRRLRRIDHFTRMALLAGFMALEDAGLLGCPRPPTGVIVATGNGATANQFDGIMELTDDNEIFGSPTRFAASVHNAAAATLAILIKEKGPNLTVSQFDQSMAQALLAGLQWLKEGRVALVLVGGVDEYNYASGAAWRNRHQDGSTQGDQPEPTAMVGEGAAFFVLGTDTSVRGSEAPYATIESVFLGNRHDLPEDLNRDKRRALILAADGYSRCHDTYPNLLPPGSERAVYTGLYGGLPIGQAFDVAIAALSISQQRMYASIAPQDGFMAPMALLNAHTTFENRGLGCLKFTVAEACSFIKMSPC